MSGGSYERLPMYAASPRQRASSPPSPTSPLEPAQRTFRRHENPQSSRNRIIIKPRHVYALIKIALPLTLLTLLLGLYFYEPHIELAFYDRNWVTKEIEPIVPLSGCFDENRVSASYNISQYVYGPKRTEVHAGMPMRMGMDCYNFAGTIKSENRPASQSIPAEERTQYHTYWRNDLAPFGPRQEWMLKSFFATQDISRSRLTLWSNGELATDNLILQTYLKRFPDAFAIKVADIPTLAKGTELDGSSLLTSKDAKAWVDGDLIRLLLLWNFGGVWVDMDSLLTRDLDPLLEHEFVTQWDCYDKLYVPLNGALMRFRKHSPYLCEAFHVITTSPPPRSGSTDWGATLYLKLWRRLLAGSIPPFKVLPFCFSDGRSCRLDNRLPDPFVPDHKDGKWTGGLTLQEGGGLDDVLHKIFGVHLHNQWEKPYPENGWVERLLLKRYNAKLEGRF
ncbi:glycosyltransferase family 32 protein [Pholiota conissans]|uniref:Glycosyltransferase family 32 protein n=1 Tax=Pholiota conissans TaxID=109636 RepID=A0A9P5YU83_9AGAR|nr:glycosyltransferase family 32 protein [Pholiota conissans]